MQGERLETAYEIIRGDARHLPDVSAFIETLNKLEVHPALETRMPNSRLPAPPAGST